MNGQGVYAESEGGRPVVRKHVTFAAIVFPTLLLGGLAFGFYVLYPEFAHAGVETTMDRMRWFGVPLLTVAVIFGGSWIATTIGANAREQDWRQKARELDDKNAASHTEQARREYVLEVLGLGVTLDKHRQGKLWNALQQGHPYATIRESDPKKYSWSAFDKDGDTGSRASDALENGAKPSPMFWGVPSMYAGTPIADPAKQPTEIDPMPGLAGGAETTGMAWHLFVTGPWQLGERPDRLLEQAFALFDAYPDLPYLVLVSADDMMNRDDDRTPGAPSGVRDGYYIPERPDASAVFVLARRERVEPLRPYVWDDPDNDYLQENLRMMYCQLMEDVPTAAKLAHTEQFRGGRQPTVAEWLRAAAAFAAHPVFDKKEGSPIVDAFKRWTNHPPRDWKPTPWFPVPWNKAQMQAFDGLPSLGFVHRPVFVKFEDEEGKPVTRRDARLKLLEAGWQQALHTLPDAERTKGPARIVAAFDNNVDHLIAMENMLHGYSAKGGPEIDSGKTAQFINTDRRLGNTGAATFFVQMAIGVMGSYIEGGTSAAVNLRDPAGASIVFISPPNEDERKRQANRDVFKHAVTPDIDPGNYVPPTMGAVFGDGATPGNDGKAAN